MYVVTGYHTRKRTYKTLAGLKRYLNRVRGDFKRVGSHIRDIRSIERLEHDYLFQSGKWVNVLTDDIDMIVRVKHEQAE